MISCRVAGSSRVVPIEFDGVADLAAANRWRSTFRRLSHLDLRRRPSGWHCTVHGTGHRRPVHRSVPLRVALGLAALGTPVIAHLEP